VLQAQENKVIGTWLNEEGTSHIRVFIATNGYYYGKIDWLKEKPDRVDDKNPDISKRNAPLMGLLILKRFSYDSKKRKWINGTIYDPKNGKTYDCYMWFENDPDLLIIKGYVMGMKFIGRETKWRRVKD
jgi:uncharacterized protein (DUF2147 family)